jgi:hypothetical protein
MKVNPKNIGAGNQLFINVFASLWKTLCFLLLFSFF